MSTSNDNALGLMHLNEHRIHRLDNNIIVNIINHEYRRYLADGFKGGVTA